MIQHYVTDQIWFDCEHCGKKITHHSMHNCFVMNPDILPTLEEWKLICEMVKKNNCEVFEFKHFKESES